MVITNVKQIKFLLIRKEFLESMCAFKFQIRNYEVMTKLHQIIVKKKMHMF